MHKCNTCNNKPADDIAVRPIRTALTIVLGIVAILLVAVTLLACGKSSGDIFRVSKVQKIEINDDAARVQKVLGKPCAATKTDERWEYFDAAYEKLINKAAQNAAAQEQALLSGDMEKLAALMQDAERLRGEMRQKTYKYICVTFANNGYVQSVLFEPQRNDSLVTTEKTVKKLSLDNNDTIGYYTHDTGDTIEYGALDQLSTYTAYFIDDSFYRSSVTNAEIQTENNEKTIIWHDIFAQYSTTKTTEIGSVNAEGVWETTNKNITKLILPDCVTCIEDTAFSHSNLKSITIPASVKVIGTNKDDPHPYQPFIFCASLENITVEEGNATYHSKENCLIETKSKTLIAGCKNSVIPSDGSVTSIGRGAFLGCTELSSIIIPDGITNIESYAFNECNKLRNITLPDSVSHIGSVNFLDACVGAFARTAFYDNIANWKNGVLYIGKHLIEIKDTISGNFTIKNGTLTVADYAFFACGGLTNITIPDSVTSIGKGAFQYCSGLTSITIPNSVTSIGWGAFFGCSSLTSISLPFIGISKYETETAYFGLPFWLHSSNDGIPASLRTVTITGGTNIKQYAFSWCYGITSITIPDSVTSIEEYSFYGCSSLTDIYCEAKEKPNGWDDKWNFDCSATVHWGDEWEYVNGVPTVKEST